MEKQLRHSFDTAKDKLAIHMISAFASEARLIFGQRKVDDKSNEINAIPELLRFKETETISIKALRKKAGWSNKALAQILLENF